MKHCKISIRASAQFLGGLEAGIQPGTQAGRGPSPSPALVPASGGGPRISRSLLQAKIAIGVSLCAVPPGRWFQGCAIATV